MVRACIALGSNLDNPRAQVERAIAALRAHPALNVIAESRLYGSTPVGPAQPDFVNAVVLLETALEPLALLDELQALETAQKRQRDGERWGPRTLDLDVLLYGEDEITNIRLAVPHPRMTEREFVLRPLCDVCPDCTIPGDPLTVSEHLARMQSDHASIWLLD
ncbi:MAG: 2-amino-4-hydroxy-6-hydroxymethyldihydropteridine diphosphokinase [Pseudomonadota bacterium]